MHSENQAGWGRLIMGEVASNMCPGCRTKSDRIIELTAHLLMEHVHVLLTMCARLVHAC